MLFYISANHSHTLMVLQEPQRRFGFGFINVGWMLTRSWNADEFFDGMFLTPPFPSTVQFDFPQGAHEFRSDLRKKFILRVMERASIYPNIKLGLSLGFADFDDPGEMLLMKEFVNTFRNSPWANTIGYIGVDGEHFGSHISSNLANMPAAYDKIQLFIEGIGYEFISYYPQGFKGTSTQRKKRKWMIQTNYPNGDHPHTLRWGFNQSHIVGITAGLDGDQIFPSPGCARGGTPQQSLVSRPNGFIPPAGTPGTFEVCNNRVPGSTGFEPTIREFMEVSALGPLSNMLWCNIVAGNSAADHKDRSANVNFTGGSGKPHNRLWDHPLFRQEMQDWIDENPGVLLQGAADVNPPPKPPPDEDKNKIKTLLAGKYRISENAILEIR